MATEREIIRQTAGLTATALGHGWSVDTSPDLDDHWGSYLNGPNGARLFLSADRTAHGSKRENVDRVVVAGIYPHGETPSGVERHEIGVKRDRGPGVLAREITRRLLPLYLPELHRVEDYQLAQVQAQESRVRVAQRLAAALPGGSVDLDRTNRDPARQVSWHTAHHGTYGDVRLSHDGDHVSEMTLRGITIDQALAIARLLHR